jgi:hypothetical protein
MPAGALTLIEFEGTDTEHAAEGAATEQAAEETKPTDGNEPIVTGMLARSGDSACLRARGLRVTERATS